MEKTWRKTAFSSILGKVNFAKVFACISLIAFMGLMIANPAYYLDSARRALSLFFASVLPSLFPFYFCSLLLTYMGMVGSISKLGERPMRALYNTPKESAYILMLSMLCGYPVGASTCAELYEGNIINKNDVKSISAFASTSGPVFILGTVGSAIFHNKAIGWIILLSHYAASLLNGLIYRKRKREEQSVGVLKKEDADNLLARVISKATLNMLYVGGYIVICGMIIDTLELLGVRNALYSALDESTAQCIISLLYGAIEMTRGSLECAQCPIHFAVAICSALITFGGLSITLQNYTFLSKCKMKMSEILLRKCTQCLIAGLVAFGLSFCLKL